MSLDSSAFAVSNSDIPRVPPYQNGNDRKDQSRVKGLENETENGEKHVRRLFDRHDCCLPARQSGARSKEQRAPGNGSGVQETRIVNSREIEAAGTHCLDPAT